MPPARRESGFTLIEVLIVVAISTAVMGGVAGALMMASKNYTNAATRLIQSHDAQLLSSWVNSDITSTGPNAADVDVTAGTSSTGCSGAVVPGSTSVLKLSWSDFAGGTTFSTAYRLEGHLFVRYACTAAGAPTRTVVGHNVQTAVVSVTGAEIGVVVTVSVSGSVYTFSVAASRRVTAVPATTTTLPLTTTSTTTPPCLVATNATPASVVHGSGGTLASNVTVSVNITGTCASLSVSFNTGGQALTLPLTLVGSTWSVIIAKGTYTTWTVASHPFTVIQAGLAIGGTPNPIPFSVT